MRAVHALAMSIGEAVMDFVFFFAGIAAVAVGLFIIKRSTPNPPRAHH